MGSKQSLPVIAYVCFQEVCGRAGCPYNLRVSACRHTCLCAQSECIYTSIALVDLVRMS
jgi:hypothetical protein